ncbi:MarC family protein [Acinetobacter bereziniae]|uniref:MarC family protein n=1 Tax=Acinetobacter bereziniae TaxID=106648 RepID=UPI0021CFB57C|nr:MarC family protein [Acinetobacter bereziniae]MCU4315197.1 MarC family protein [Acinetobacter bereziniae]
MFSNYIHSFALFFSLLNPFLMSIYMIGMIRHTETKVFNKSLAQGALIAYVVFLLFAWGGEAIFSSYLNVRFESFQIFGGLIFLVIGYRFVFQGADTIGEMRGTPAHLASTMAMPFMIGPGTISAAVVTGVSMSLVESAFLIAFTLFISCGILMIMKFGHDHLRYSHAKYIDRYFDIVGRLSALLIGTIAIDMIANGIIGLMNKY